jgi:hypothetical protein
MRLLLDATLSTVSVGRRLAELGHDVGALGLEPALDTLSDEEVLELATKDGSILVTMNAADYPPVLREWALSRRSHAGVILLHGIRPADLEMVVEAVAATLEQRPAQDEWTDRAVVAVPIT